MTAVEEHTYRLLLEHRGTSLADLAKDVGVARGSMSRIVASLEQMGLVTRSPGQPPRLLAAPPDIAIAALVHRREQALKEAQLASLELARRYTAKATGRPIAEMVEVAEGLTGVSRRAEQVQLAAEDEVLLFDTPPYTDPEAASNETEIDLLSRDVRYRVIYDQTALEHPGQLELLREMTELGELARVVARLPAKLLIADRRVGILVFANPEFPDTEGAVVVHSSPLLHALLALFESYWEKAVPITFGRNTDDIEGIRAASWPPTEYQELLSLVASGMKDGAIARRLGIAPRTVQRRIAAAMSMLGAQTRFQAGLLASRRGWL